MDDKPEFGDDTSQLEARLDLAMQHGVRFLLANRAKDGVAWGLIRNDESDLHYSSLAVAALSRIRSPLTRQIVSEVCSEYLLPGYRSYEFRALQREALAAVVRTTAVAEDVLSTGTPDVELTSLRNVVTRMHDRSSSALNEHVRSELATLRENPKELAKLLLVSGLYARESDRDKIADALVAALSTVLVQEGDLGWWTSGRGTQEPDVIATCLALLALNYAKSDAGRPLIQMASRFLVVNFTSAVWSEIFVERFIYGQSVVVRALAAISPTLSDELRRSCSRLCQLQAGDGGWGDDSEIGNVEATSHALISLAEARLPLFGSPQAPMALAVPVEVARADSKDEVLRTLRALQEASNRSTHLLERLQRDVAALHAELGVRQKQTELALLVSERRKVMQNSLGMGYEPKSERRRVAMVVVGSFVFTLVAGAALAFDITRTFGIWWAVASGGLAALGLGGVFAGIYSRARLVLVPGPGPAAPSVASAVREFWPASESLKFSQTRRLLLLLERNLAGLPEDLFIAEARHLVLSEGIRDARLIDWITMLAGLQPSDRLEVLSAISRGLRRWPRPETIT